MQEITQILKDFRMLSRAEYLAKRPEPVLLHRTNRGDPNSELGFAAGLERDDDAGTSMVKLVTDEVDTARSETGLLVFSIKPLVGREGTPQITVGRTKGRDIQLPYNRVSKLHAYFTWSGDRSKWFVADANSTNGTFLFGERLAAEEPTLITSGMELRFGTSDFLFHRAEDFLEYLTKLMSRSQKPGG